MKPHEKSPEILEARRLVRESEDAFMDDKRGLDMLTARIREVDEREFEEKTEQFQGYDYGLDTQEDGSFVTWDAKQKGKETPKPLHFKHRLGDRSSWKEWVEHPRMKGKTFVIFGAGSSALDLPLSLLDGEIVYGINWTRKWFEPTFLQVVDPPVMRSQVLEGKFEDSPAQLVTSTRCAVDVLGGRQNAYDSLNFHIHHATQEAKQHEIHLAETPNDRMTWYANSLGWALNVACWFRPKRIVLLGFDFGGAHFFGDGRAEGASCHYGLGGNLKPHLLDKLEAVRDFVSSRGIPVRQVGQTNLGLFWKCETLEEALYF